MPTKETSLLKQTCPACGTTVDTTAAEPLARVACQNCGEKIRAERSFDHFVLLETIGIGGMGTVYKARDTLLDRLVALKLLRKDLGEHIDYAARLRQEARLAASINHPNVIQVFSSGTDHDQFYLVMELVDHGSLDDLIEQKKRLPEELVIEAGIQVATGLRAAYAKGLIHRDVKPANILFADEHTAKIGDFGLAGAAAEGAETRGEIWGTPYYVAPERLNNEAEDFRSDIYSLGATLYHAMSGRAPIDGESNSAVTLRKLKSEPVDLRLAAPEVSEPTVSVLNRMIAPDPAKRFASYDDLVAELQNAYGLLTGKKEFLATRRKKLPWIIGMIVLLLAVVGIGLWAFITRKHDKSALTALSARTEQLIAIAPLQARLADGRRQLAQGHHKLAAGTFAEVATNARNRQPIYDWARLQQGLAAMIARENSQARQAFQDVENVGVIGFDQADRELAQFCIETAKTLLRPGVIPGREQAAKTPPYAALAALLFGIHDVNDGDATNAAAWLQAAVSAQPGGAFSWISELKPVAQRYLDDCRVYIEWKKASAATNEPEAINRQLDLTRATRKKLKTRSALSDQVNAEEKSLSGQAASQQKTESDRRVQEQKKRDQQLAQEVTLKKPQWLADWQKRLIDDLNRVHFSGEITDITGVRYSGIEGATQQGLTVKIGAYGSGVIPWAKFTPQSLLAISTSFIAPNTPEAADRYWLAAVYASEAGLTTDAKRLADEAAKIRAEYGRLFGALQAQGRSGR